MVEKVLLEDACLTPVAGEGILPAVIPVNDPLYPYIHRCQAGTVVTEKGNAAGHLDAYARQGHEGFLQSFIITGRQIFQKMGRPFYDGCSLGNIGSSVAQGT